MHLLNEWLAPLTLTVATSGLFVLVVSNVLDAQRAHARGENLLRRILTPAELGQLNRYHYLDVASRRHANRTYRVPARAGTVLILHNGVRTHGVCIRPIDPLPGREHVLAHKALLEADEDEYLKRANIVFGSRTW
ncbi:MAG TPA: hypothetical protein VFB50_21805 [Chloroflexota bacterium]|nr:hypothetical protein [Chloroflexota bacterium]